MLPDSSSCFLIVIDFLLLLVSLSIFMYFCVVCFPYRHPSFFCFFINSLFAVFDLRNLEDMFVFGWWWSWLVW